MIAGWRTKKYKLLECTYITNINEDDDETKHIFWIDEERKLMVGAQDYPFDSVPCQYVPFYIKNEKNGIYQEGIAEDLRSSDNMITAILQFSIEGWWQANTVTPVTENQGIINDFYNY